MSLGVLEGPQPKRPALGLTYDNQTPDDATKALQAQISGFLAAKGMAPLTVDGKLGAGTCGAARYLDQNSGTQFMSGYGLTSICKAYTDPKPAGSSSKPTPVNISSPSSASPDAFATQDSTIFGMPAKTVGIIVLGAVGLYLFTNKKKGAKA